MVDCFKGSHVRKMRTTELGLHELLCSSADRVQSHQELQRPPGSPGHPSDRPGELPHLHDLVPAAHQGALSSRLQQLLQSEAFQLHHEDVQVRTRAAADGLATPMAQPADVPATPITHCSAPTHW